MRSRTHAAAPGDVMIAHGAASILSFGKVCDYGPQFTYSSTASGDITIIYAMNWL